jgi:hypothetical protein
MASRRVFGNSGKKKKTEKLHMDQTPVTQVTPVTTNGDTQTHQKKKEKRRQDHG